MSHAADQRLAAAKQRFVRFFTELEEVFIEREELLMQIALALLSREHVLMTGPPGTAKSGIASAVLRRVVDETTREPSLFARQFTESTVQTDLVGPINFKTLMEYRAVVAAPPPQVSDALSALHLAVVPP